MACMTELGPHEGLTALSIGIRVSSITAFLSSRANMELLCPIPGRLVSRYYSRAVPWGLPSGHLASSRKLIPGLVDHRGI